jgi:probable phosphoglycerate mutase
MARTGHDVVLVRHGETEWSRSGQHTGTTDIPLTEAGRRQAAALARRLRDWDFALVLSSPLSRALETARLAGLGESVHVRDDLREWDYGEYEGITTKEIHERNPGWFLFRDGAPGGESVADVSARADRVLAELRFAPGDAAVFAHGHILRVLAARWMTLAPEAGAGLALSTAAVSVLGGENERPVTWQWNDDRHLAALG